MDPTSKAYDEACEQHLARAWSCQTGQSMYSWLGELSSPMSIKIKDVSHHSATVCVDGGQSGKSSRLEWSLDGIVQVTSRPGVTSHTFTGLLPSYHAVRVRMLGQPSWSEPVCFLMGSATPPIRSVNHCSSKKRQKNSKFAASKSVNVRSKGTKCGLTLKLDVSNSEVHVTTSSKSTSGGWMWTRDSVVQVIQPFGLQSPLDIRCLPTGFHRLQVYSLDDGRHYSDHLVFDWVDTANSPRAMTEQEPSLENTSASLIDIGANLLDPMFQGVYNGSRKHPADLDVVLQRAAEHGVSSIIVTAGSVDECTQAQELLKGSKSKQPSLFTTVGVHPTRCTPFENPSGAVSTVKALEELIVAGKGSSVVAVGECGLDYDRLQFCDKAAQRTGFEAQLRLAVKHQLPLFLHNRNCGDDFIDMVSQYSDQIVGGVVHSFTGTVDEMRSLVALGLFIGVNGCSLKTQENIDVVRAIPLNRIMLETDAPWCEIKNTHAGSSHVKTKIPSKKKEKYESSCTVKGRCEPFQMRQVLEVVAAIKCVQEEDLARQAHLNTIQLFGGLE